MGVLVIMRCGATDGLEARGRMLWCVREMCAGWGGGGTQIVHARSNGDRFMSISMRD